jgi:hypothetical protein
MVFAQRTVVNPLARVRKVDTRGREVRLRRALTDEEVGRLLINAGESKIGYLFAVHTGLRRSELRALTWQNINLDSDRPSVSIIAGTAKNRTAVTLPLHPELVAELRAIKLLNACGIDKVLVGRMVAGMWKMKSDLKKAGIQFIENGRRVDLHALRHTFNTNIIKTDAPPRVAMEAMRHSDLRLTMKVYTDANMLPVGDLFPLLPAFWTAVESTSRTHAQMHTQIPDVCRPEITPPDTTVPESAESKVREHKGLGHQLAQTDGDWQTPEFGSSGRIRTYDQSVNSRPLYH